MVSAEDIRNTILHLANQANGQGITPMDVAQKLRPAQWQEILDQVTLVTDSLFREGKIAKAKNSATERYFINK